MNEFKACPFCGGKILICRGIDGEINGILCHVCHAKVRWSDIKFGKYETYGENEKKWIEKWNRRVND